MYYQSKWDIQIFGLAEWHCNSVGSNSQEGLTANLEELHEVVKLAVDISTDRDGAGHSLAGNRHEGLVQSCT